MELPPILPQNPPDHKPLNQEIERQPESRDYVTIQASYCHYVRGDDQDHTAQWISPSKTEKKIIMRPTLMKSDQNITAKGRRRKHDHHDQKQGSHECSSESSVHGGLIRSCSACNTTKTPLWRSGPCGPKSLCNACGIRQMKARRAMAAATASAGSGRPPAAAAAARNAGKEESLDGDRRVPFKKRCRFTAAQRNEMVMGLKKSSAFQRVFQQDEKEAAILLMALSSGVICSS